jgi:hypothetical protein
MMMMMMMRSAVRTLAAYVLLLSNLNSDTELTLGMQEMKRPKSEGVYASRSEYTLGGHLDLALSWLKLCRTGIMF